MTIEDWLDGRLLTMADLIPWNIIYDKVLHRLVVPVYSSESKYCLDIIRKLESEPKYEKSPARCRPSCVLYGLNRTKLAIKYADMAVIVEGFSDVLTCVKMGEINVVAALTSNLSKIQLAIIHVYASKLIIWGDGDDAGREFAKKLSGKQYTGITVIDHDPPSFARAGGDIKSIVRAAEEMSETFSYIEFTSEGGLSYATERVVESSSKDYSK